MGKLVTIYSPTQAARFIDMRLSGIERRGFRGQAAQELLSRPDKIAVEFRKKNPVKVVGITAESIAAESITGIEPPEMVAISRKLSIMKDNVSVGLFKQVMGGYKISGHNALKLEGILLDPSRTKEEVTYVSLLDAREFAKRLSDLTGRKFRVPAKAEWISATRKAEEIFRSFDTYLWTETNSNNGEFILGHTWGSGFLFRMYEYQKASADERYDNHSIRLVEDLPQQKQPAGKLSGFFSGFFSGLARPANR